VIFLTPKYCDPLLFDLPMIIQKLNEKGVPSLSLEISGFSSEGTSGILHIRKRSCNKNNRSNTF
jgi:hypothetical protein